MSDYSIRPQKNLRRSDQTEVPDQDPYRRRTPQDQEATSKSGMGLVIAFFVLLCIAIPAYFLYPVARDLYNQNRLRETGLMSVARVVRVVETNTHFNNQRVYDLTLLITPETGEPYEVQVSQPLSPLATAGLATGSHVEVRYDPQDPKQVVVTKTGLSGAPTPAVNTPDKSAPLAPAPDDSAPEPSIPSEPSANSTDRSACTAATRCCLIVVGKGSDSACETFSRMEQIPVSACTQALVAYERAAVQLGRSCERAN